MKSTIELAQECGMTISGYNIHANLQATFYADIECLEGFRKACEADFISRCENIAQFVTDERRVELIGHWNFSNLAITGHYPNIPLYTLPEE